MKSVEIFAGAGGLGIGLQRAGFTPLDVVEWDRWCCDTLRENAAKLASDVSSWTVTEGDVRGIDFTKYDGKLDLISGGPPCQPFSLGGKHRSDSDRRDMFPEAIRAIRESGPKAFVLENVKGLTRTAFRNYFEYIRLQLQYPDVVIKPGEGWSDHLRRLERHHTSGSYSGLNYRVVSRVLNSANFGVPQKRERVFLVGFRSDLGIEWSFPESTHSEEALLWDQLDGEYWERHAIPAAQRMLPPRLEARARKIKDRPESKPWKTVRDAIFDLPDPEFHPLLASEFADHGFQPGARSYKGHTGSPYDRPAKTLKAGVHGVPGGENMLRRGDDSVRYFTVRESARLQTFPDEIVFHGAWSETMRQLGNAVPVDLAHAIGVGVADELNSVPN